MVIRNFVVGMLKCHNITLMWKIAVNSLVMNLNILMNIAYGIFIFLLSVN